MNNLKRIISVFLLAALLLSGCGSAKTPAPVPDTGRTVVDCSGREVTLPPEVDSVACLYAYTGHLTVLLGCEDRIDAVVKGLKRDLLMERKLENLEDMPCPYSAGDINMEELAAVAPDVIFLRVETLVDSGEVEKLDNLGIPYVFFDYVTMADQLDSIALMGACLGTEARAAEYMDLYRKTVSFVEERLAAVPEEERLTVYHSVNEVVRTDIPDTLSFEVLKAAGCRNVVGSSEELRVDGDKGMATVEQIYVWDPDVVLANEPEATKYFRNNEKFTGLRAVQEGNVFQLPVGISRWAHPGSIESPLAVLYIAKLLYPDCFTDIDMEQEVHDFYQKWFSIDLTDEDISLILSGEGMRLSREGT